MQGPIFPPGASRFHPRKIESILANPAQPTADLANSPHTVLQENPTRRYSVASFPPYEKDIKYHVLRRSRRIRGVYISACFQPSKEYHLMSLCKRVGAPPVHARSKFCPFAWT